MADAAADAVDDSVRVIWEYMRVGDPAELESLESAATPMADAVLCECAPCQWP